MRKLAIVLTILFIAATAMAGLGQPVDKTYTTPKGDITFLHENHGDECGVCHTMMNEMPVEKPIREFPESTIPHGKAGLLLII